MNGKKLFPYHLYYMENECKLCQIKRIYYYYACDYTNWNVIKQQVFIVRFQTNYPNWELLYLKFAPFLSWHLFAFVLQTSYPSLTSMTTSFPKVAKTVTRHSFFPSSKISLILLATSERCSASGKLTSDLTSP